MKRAFTLIELLLAMSLIVVASGVGLLSFQKNSRRESVNATADKFQQLLLKIKDEAQAGKTGGKFDDNSTCNPAQLQKNLMGWGLAVTGSAGNLTSVGEKGSCSRTDLSMISDFASGEILNIPTTMTMSANPVTMGGGQYPLYIYFQPVTGGVLFFTTKCTPGCARQAVNQTSTIGFTFTDKQDNSITSTVNLTPNGEVL